MFDGDAFLDQVPVPVILDNLIGQQRIPPMVAALVGNAAGRRNADTTTPGVERFGMGFLPPPRPPSTRGHPPDEVEAGGTDQGRASGPLP